MRYERLIAHSSLPAPSRRRCCHRARRGQSQPADGRDGRLGLSCDGCAQPKVERVDARPTSTQRQCRGEETTSMDCVTDEGGHGSTPKGQTAHSVHMLECADLVDERLRPCGLAASVTHSIGGVASPRHRRRVEAARADQRAFVRSDAVDPRDRCTCHLRWRGSGSGSPLRAVENADVLLNIHDRYTHNTSLFRSLSTFKVKVVMNMII